MTSAPPGWYSQPDGNLRYWDGVAWTAHTRSPDIPPPPEPELSRNYWPPDRRDTLVPVWQEGPPRGATDVKTWLSRHATGLKGLFWIAVIAAIGLVAIGTYASNRSVSSDGRQIQATYYIRLDPERMLQVDLDGAFTARDDTSQAAAGKTHIVLSTSGTATVTNVSSGRTTDEFDQDLEVFLPAKYCPASDGGRQADHTGKYCKYLMFELDVPALDAGESHVVPLKSENKVDEVDVGTAGGVLAALRGPEAVVVSADNRLFLSQQMKDLNPTCRVPGSDTLWVTYFSESPTVDACSTVLAATDTNP